MIMPIKAKALRQTSIFLALLALALFAPAGRIDIWQFWIYLAIMTAISLLAIAILDADLIAERMRPGGRNVFWRFLPVSALVFLHWSIAGYDRGHLYLGTEIPALWQMAGLLVFAGGWILVLWAMRVNRYFSSIPRIQTERGHRVVADGPYAWLRHPGYAGALLAAVSSPIALGSWRSAFIAPIAAVLLVGRIAAEESLLIQQLPGYREYAQQVRYRLVPGIW